MTMRFRQVRATTLADKLAYWINHRINVLFRCGPAVCIVPEVSVAFGNAGLQWRTMSAFSKEFEQILSDDTVEAVLIDGLDRVSKKLRRAVLDIAGERSGARLVWATVTVLDEDDFDLEPGTVKVEGFDVVVDVRMQPTSPR